MKAYVITFMDGSRDEIDADGFEGMAGGGIVFYKVTQRPSRSKAFDGLVEVKKGFRYFSTANVAEISEV